MLQTKEWTFIDRSKWRGDASVADGEPDKLQWEDKATGLPCLIHRNHGGALCGYVGVSKSHPYYEKNYNEVDVDVHGGLTFSDFCGETEESGRGVCHVSDNHEKVWWLGFDCAHLFDVSPAYDYDLFECSYKDISYVKLQVESLAKQIHAHKKEKE